LLFSDSFLTFPIFLKKLTFPFPMFDSPDYPKSLPESLFESWFETGRSSRIPYAYLLVIWDEIEGKYLPVFVEKRADISSYDRYGESPATQTLVAAYDLYSEGRVA
jgi:hypothetical protein